MRRVVALVLCVAAAACGDDPEPVDIDADRLTVRIESVPAAITLLLDGEPVWSTQRGGQQQDKKTPPLGFAAVGSRAVTVEMQFGSFKFTENKDAQAWRAIDELASVKVTGRTATFDLLHEGGKLGTGTLEILDPQVGAAPTADGYPHQVRIHLDTGAQDRIQLASPCSADEHLLGLGGHTFDVDHNGETVPLWVQEPGIGKFDEADDDYTALWMLTGRRHSASTPMPMMLSSKGYAIGVRTLARSIFALGPAEHPGVCRYEAWEGALDLNVFVGGGDHTARSALGYLVNWAGKPAARPPLGIFAPWIDAIYGEANVRRVAQKLRTLGIPSSAIWTEDFRGGHETLSGYALDEDWRLDRDTYPTFEQLAGDLHGMGFAFLTYFNSFIDDTADVLQEAVASGYVMKNPEGEPYSFQSITLTGQSKLLDLSNPDAVRWGQNLMRDNVAQGADGWMVDFAEWAPTDAQLHSGEDALLVHNRYTTDWLKMNAEVLKPQVGRFAPIHFIRSAWLGSQEHTQVIWAGDQQTDYSAGDGLPAVIPMGLNLGLAGFPYYGSDVAGYMSQGTQPTDEELFYRWTTFGAMQPVMRTHHGRSARENFQWEHDTNSEQHFRRWARFHMQLAAYFWGSIGSYEQDGLPLFRLTALEYPDEAWAWTTIDQYLLGDRLLVAPVQVKGATSREVKLPAGDWYPLFGGMPVNGPSVTATASIREIPAYIRAGSILVLYPEGVDTTYPASGSPATTSVDEVGGNREVWLFGGDAAGRAVGRWNDEGGTVGPAQWTWVGRLAGASAPTSATFKGAAVPVTMENGVATVTVVGDGELSFNNGGTLAITRGLATASVKVRVR